MTVKPIILEGPNVRLEPLCLEHHSALCEVGLDPELWKVTVDRVVDRDGMTSYIQRALDAQEEGRALAFATIDKRSGRVVGCTRFTNIDQKHSRVEIGSTWVAVPWQRTVVNTEAKYLMLRHAFETMGCARVEFKTDAINERSRQALRRLGAREEGIFRRHMLTWDGRMRDTVYFSILDAEWPAVKAELERKLHSQTQSSTGR
ncbi:MAG: GNAT family protein [Bryobacteraceae bacterium]